MGKEGELKNIPRPFSTIEWSHEAEPDQLASPTGVRFKGAQRPKWRPPAAEGAVDSEKEGGTDPMKQFQESLFSDGAKTKATEKTVPLAIHDGLKREKDQLSMQLKALAEKYEGSKKRIAGLEQDLYTSQQLVSKYEGMYVIPLNDDLQALTDSISEIDKDIKKYETAIVDTEVKRTKSMAVPSSSTGKAQVLLETKVQRMEQLVYTLKKRVNKYENCVDDRSDTAKFDSKEYLRKENLRLAKEVKRLMTAEMKFDTESLLNKKALSTYDPMLFDVLITALQDDLKCHKRLLDQYSFERNPELQFLVKTPAPLSELEGLPDLLAEWGCEDSIVAATPGDEEDEDTLRHERSMLKEQLSKLQSDYEQLHQQLEMERESNGVEGRKVTGKARKIELLMESNKENLRKISDAHTELRKKDEVLATQEKLTKRFIREKEGLLSDTMQLNHEVSRQRSRNQELRGVVSKLHQELLQEKLKSAGVHTLSLSLIHAFCTQAGMEPLTQRSVVSKNFMSLWTTMSQAIVVIQAAARGTLGRLGLVERFGRGKVVSWAERQDLDNKRVKSTHKRTVEDYQGLGLSAAHALKAVSTSGGTREPREKFTMPPLMERFPATCALAELAKFSEKDQYKWVQVPEYLKVVKAEVCSDLRKSTEAELATMKAEMVRYGCRMLKQVTVKTKETRPQAVQAGPPLANLVELEMQTDETPPEPDDGGKKKK